MEIELARLFVKVVQHGGFSRAAELLKIPKSTISKAISRLEQETGTKLLLRTTRSQTLTPAGRVFYETCLEPIQILEDAQKSLYGQDSIISGTIKLTAPEDLGTHVISPVIGELCRKHPQLSFDLQYTNQIIDMIKDGFDLAIRIGKLGESRLMAKKIGEIILAPVAAPSYLKSAEKIRTPKDLVHHECLALSSTSLTHTWRFKNKKGNVDVSIKSRIESNQVTSLHKMAIGGAGVAFIPLFLCKPEIASGQLIRILPDWCGVGIPVSMLSPISTAASARLKLASDSIVQAIREALVPE